MKKSYLTLIASIVFACLLGLMFGYLYGSSQSKKQPTTLMFSDLPSQEQSRYISKDEASQIKSFLSIEKEDIVPADEPIQGSDEELKAQIKELRGINQELYRENVELSDKGWELALKVKEKEKEVLSEKERFKARSLENINEAEQQHYKNVNDLTKRINELQQQSIESTKNYENQIVILENSVDELKQTLQKKEFEKNEEINVATKQERINNSTLAEKNRHLLEQIEIMKSKMTEQFEENSKNLQAKKNEIINLKRDLSQKDAKSSTMLTEHTNEILQMEQKHTSVLKGLREDIVNIQKQYKKDMARKNSEISSLMALKKEEIQNVKQAITSDKVEVDNALIIAKKENQHSLDTIASLRKRNEALSKERNALKDNMQELQQTMKTILEQKDKKHALMLKDLKNKTLSSAGKESEALEKLQKQALEDSQNLDSLKSQNIELAKKLQKLQTEVQNRVGQEKFQLNEEKHAQNYKILNSKIVTLKSQRDAFIEKAKEEIDGLRGQIAQKDDEIMLLNEEMQLKLASLEENLTISNSEKIQAQMSEKQEQLSVLKSGVTTLKQMHKQVQSELQAKIDAKNSEFGALKEMVAKKDSQIALLQNSVEKLNQENEKIRIEHQAKSKQEAINLKKSLDESLAQITTLKSELAQSIASEKAKAQMTNKQKDFDALQAVLKKKDSEIVALKSSMSTLDKEKEKLKQELQATNTKESMKLKKSLEQSLAKVASLEDDITMLKNEKMNLKKENAQLSKQDDLKEQSALIVRELKSAKDSISALRNENKKLLEDKKALVLSNSQDFQILKKLLQDTNESLQNIENESMSLKGDLAVLEKKNQDLLATNATLMKSQAKHMQMSETNQQDFDELTNDLMNRKAEILALKNEFNTVTKNNLELREKLQALESNTQSLLGKDSSKIASLEEDNKNLENENIELSLELARLKETKSIVPSEQVISSSSAKPELLGSIKCDDMPKGVNSPTVTCKARVQKFLSQYGAGYFFEVVPIVDEGGFASLNKVARSQLGIPDSEINRLTRLSNLGLGKDRAASGGELIEEILGDNVRISYAVTNKDIPKKRGFIINAYK